MGTLRAVVSMTCAGMGTVRAVMGNMRDVVSTSRAVVGIIHAVVGTVRAVMGNLRAVMGNLRAVMGNVRAVVSMSCAVMGTLRAVKSTIRDFASTTRADMGTMSAVASTKPASGKCLASIGVESTGGIYVYDVSTPAQPRFRDVLNVCNWRLGDLTCGETCFYVSGGDGDDGVAGTESYLIELTCHLIQERTQTIPDEPYLIELTCNLNDGPKSLVCIWAASRLHLVCISSASRLHLVCIWAADSPLGLYDVFLAATPLAGGLTAYIIECGPLRGNDGSCSNSAPSPYLSTAVGGTRLYRNRDGKSTIEPRAICRYAACIEPRAICHYAACIGAVRNSTTADGLRKVAPKVVEIALEKLFIKGTIGDADVKYTFLYDQTNASEDTAGDPMEKAAGLDDAP
ncbi:hypothetical protein Ctob_016442 [Chrysochromulina tobinii]|uniref:Uncharacterized protein n=1 Tax=Chrysochromulina tobinii TaxID=1460289 RepID=A0A0M0KA87_9EUKA|nr:hypothetical protein Ctob_016442 [Chrysochromulina tobinii]|eukprot:KOO35487.1 hypothetical protein Ctob_016442 [Chrysochromulina sp. CCMP291]